MATASLTGFQLLLCSRKVASQMLFRRGTMNRLSLLAMPSRSFTGSVFLGSKRRRSTCTSNDQISSPTDVNFWKSRSTWRRASINTLRCLVGCSVGDFSTIWYLLVYYPALDLGTTMALSSKPHLLSPPSTTGFTSRFYTLYLDLTP
jgi:hypothetical protein